MEEQGVTGIPAVIDTTWGKNILYVARLRARGEQVAFLGLLDTWPPETQNWQEKEANGLDPEVLAEINREREAFLAAQQGSTSTELFTTIEGNYADAVRLLTGEAAGGGEPRDYRQQVEGQSPAMEPQPARAFNR